MHGEPVQVLPRDGREIPGVVQIVLESAVLRKLPSLTVVVDPVIVDVLSRENRRARRAAEWGGDVAVAKRNATVAEPPSRGGHYAHRLDSLVAGDDDQDIGWRKAALRRGASLCISG